ncbi:MAG: hypothetical protein UHK52_02180 [Bacteroidales bacterium]|nr:hypothetical protein [Bacteroidales bacterium]
MREEEKEKETENDSYVLNVYATIGLLIVLVYKSLKLFGISINSTLQWVLVGAGVLFLIIGIVKAIIDKMKE